MSMIRIDNGITNINTYIKTKDCQIATELYLPSSIIYIWDMALYFCKNIVKIIYQGTKEMFHRIFTGTLFENSNIETVECIDGTIQIRR